MQVFKSPLILLSFLSLFIISSCNSDGSQLRTKAASEVRDKSDKSQTSPTTSNQNSFDRTQTNDQYGADSKTLTLFTVNWIMRIKEDGSGSFGQGQNGNLYAKFPSKTFEFDQLAQKLSSAVEEDGSFGQSIAFTISGGPKVQKPNYIENFDYCKSIFTKAYNALPKEEKHKIEENFKKSPPVSAYNY